MDEHDLTQLGPLRALAGEWEGDMGTDLAPADDRTEVEKNLYREELVLTPIEVHNHDQALYGLRYSMSAYRLGASDSFHEELGYWLYEPATQLVMRCLVVPRGVTVLAGGKAAPDARSFDVSAELGAPTFGVLSNPYLDREFKTVRFTTRITIEPDGGWSYDEHTLIEIPGREGLFDHRDTNTLRRVSRP